MKFLILLALVGFAAAYRNEAEEYFLRDLFKDLKQNFNQKFKNYDWQTDRIKYIGKDFGNFLEDSYNEEKDLALQLYDQIKEQLKERADQVLEESKGEWMKMKDTLLVSKDQFLEEFETITNKALDKVVAPLKGRTSRVSTTKVTGSLVEQLKAKIEAYTDTLKTDFEGYYKDLVEAAAESVDDVLILVDSQQTTLTNAVDQATDEIVATVLNGAEEFDLKQTRQKVRNFVKSSYSKAKAFGVKKYNQILAFIKTRVQAVIATSKDVWAGLKKTGKTTGSTFRDDLEDILQDSIAQVFAPIPEEKEKPGDVTSTEVRRSLTEEIAYLVNQRTDSFYRHFDIYYKRLIDASATAVENIKVAVNKMRIPMGDAIRDAAEEIVDVTLNG